MYVKLSKERSHLLVYYIRAERIRLVAYYEEQGSGLNHDECILLRQSVKVRLPRSMTQNVLDAGTSLTFVGRRSSNFGLIVAWSTLMKRMVTSMELAANIFEDVMSSTVSIMPLSTMCTPYTFSNTRVYHSKLWTLTVNNALYRTITRELFAKLLSIIG